MGVEAVIQRRRAERLALLERARGFADGLEPGLGVVAVVVIGSVARGDFNRWSDVDVVVVASQVPGSWLARQEALGTRPGLVEPVVWTPDEWRSERRRANPMALEAIEVGVWLVGSPAAIEN